MGMHLVVHPYHSLLPCAYPSRRVIAAIAAEPVEGSRALSSPRKLPNLPTWISMLTSNCTGESTATMGYEDSVYLAKLAEQAERYEG